MNRFIILTLLIILPAIHSRAQATWSKLYDFCPDTDHLSYNVAQYADDDVIVAAGVTKTQGIFPSRCYIASFDYNGQLINKKILYAPEAYNTLYYPGNTSGAYNPLIKIANNRYLLVGWQHDSTISSSYVVIHPFLYFFNSNCDSLCYKKLIDSAMWRVPISVTSDAQENICIVGDADSKNFNTNYIWLEKLDALGNSIWNKHYFEFHAETARPYKIITGHDGHSFIISAIVWNSAKKEDESIIFKIDKNGNMLWQQSIPTGQPFVPTDGMDLIPTKDGKYAFVATFDDATTSPLIYYGKFDENGDTLWTKKFKRYASMGHMGRQIAEAGNGDLILFCRLTNGAYYNAVVRTLANGDIKSYREYTYIDTTGLFDQDIIAMSFTPTKQVLLSGLFQSQAAIPGVFDSVGTFSWYVLTDTFGCLTPGCQSIDTMWHTGIPAVVNNSGVEISVYPNPVQQTLFIQTRDLERPLQAYLTGINGRRVYSRQLYSNSTHAIDVQDMPPGIYILEIWQEGRRVQVYKVIH